MAAPKNRCARAVDHGPLLSNVNGKISYDSIDTLGGSSGSAVLNAETGKIVGIHTNGGRSAFSGANFGVAIGAIRKFPASFNQLNRTATYWSDGSWCYPFFAHGIDDHGIFRRLFPGDFFSTPAGCLSSKQCQKPEAILRSQLSRQLQSS